MELFVFVWIKLDTSPPAITHLKVDESHLSRGRLKPINMFNFHENFQRSFPNYVVVVYVLRLAYSRPV